MNNFPLPQPLSRKRARGVSARLFRVMSAVVVLMLFSVAAGAAYAQYDAAPAKQQAAGQIASAPAQLPNVESTDILKQNQAERSRDQPGNLAPVYREVKEGQKQYSSLPAPEAGILIQPKTQYPGQARATTAGQAWREYRNGPLTMYGGWLLLLAIAGVAAMYFLRGPIRLNEPRTGRVIERFTSFERATHWTMAISFVLLAASGLTMLFGKYILMPVFGHTLFGWLSYLLKNIHNFAGPVFAVSVLVAFVVFVKDNLPSLSDVKWFASFGGLVGGKHSSAGRFNAGEKLWFWIGMTVIGLTMTASGFVLDMLVPSIDYTRANMQIADIVHVIGAVLLIAMAFGHIYMGTIGMEGAYDAMRTGYVDDAWAKEHHDEWYADIQSGKVPRIRTEEGAKTVGANGAGGAPAKA
jgi:formate dehydrogenase subunit gamma